MCELLDAKAITATQSCHGNPAPLLGDNSSDSFCCIEIGQVTLRMRILAVLKNINRIKVSQNDLIDVSKHVTR